MQTLSEKISRYFCELKYDDIPKDKIDALKWLTLDYLGVASKGSETDSGRIAIEYAISQGSNPIATIIGSDKKAIPMLSAFTNSISSHSIELDDVDDIALYHHSPPILSAALAMGEKMNIDGKNFLTAAYAGCETMARLSNALNPSLRNRGFHTTPVTGTFGAAVTSGIIMGLNKEKLVDALGLAGAQCSGLMEMYGESLQKRFNTGPAARNGIVAAEMAELGFSGTNEIFEGKRAMFKAFSDRYDENKFVEGLGEVFSVNIDFKPYACARPIHNGIDCVLNILKKHPDFKLNDIKKIKLYRHPDWANYHLNSTPKNINEAQVSMPYSVAVAFVKRDAFLEQYDEKLYNDPEIRKTIEKVIIEPDPKLPRGVSCLMVVETLRGDTFESQVDYPKGSKENPMTNDELVEKFKRLSCSLVSEAHINKVIDSILNLEKISNIKEVVAYFQCGK